MKVDLEYQYKEIIKKIAQYDNGVAAESMYKMGLRYQINHGLALPQIDAISKAIIRSNQLALYLWRQKERESKLIALRIAEYDKIDKTIIENIIEGINNVELAEQAAIHLIVHYAKSDEIAKELLIKSDEYKQLAGYVSVARIALVKKDIKNEILSDFIKIIAENLPKNTPIYIKRGIAQAFLRVGMKNEELKTEVSTLIKNIKTKNNELGEYLTQEVSYFL